MKIMIQIHQLCLRIFILWILLVINTIFIRAQWNSFLINYNKELYGRGAQTWDIQSYDESRTYFANNNGLVQFNGYEWAVFPLENRAEARSVCISLSGERIYVGGESEFGYFEPDPANGEITFHRLSDPFIEEYQLYGGYWGVYEVDNLVYFVSDKFIAKYLEGRFVAIPSEHKIDCSTLVNGVLYTGTSQGLRMVIGNSLLPVPGTESLDGKNIRALAPYKEGFLIATAVDGLFYYQNHQLESYCSKEDDFLVHNELFSLAVSGSRIAIGSIYKGLLLYDEDTGSSRFFNEYNGLQNNTVLSVSFDKLNDLWVGLDDGITYIPLNESFTNLYTYPYSRGAGYAVLLRNETLYLGTNRGLFYTSFPVDFGSEPKEFQLIPGTIGQVWNLKQIGNDIFCLHDKGLYVVSEDNRITHLPEIRGALNANPDRNNPDRVWIGCYDGLALVEKKEGKWSFRKKVEDLEEWMKNMVMDSKGVVWVRIINYGFYRFTIDPDECRVIEREVYTIPDGSLDNLCLYEVGNDLLFLGGHKCWRWDEEKKVLEPYPIWNEYFIPEWTYKVVKEYNGNVYALSTEGVQIAFFDETGKYDKTVQYPIRNNQIGLIPYYESLDILDDTLIVIPNEKGFALLNTTEMPVTSSQPFFINKVYLTYPQDTLLFADNYKNRERVYEIPYKQNALRFEFGVRSYTQDEYTRYRFRLYPDTVWSAFTPAHTKEYSNLNEGRYQFEAEALYIDGRIENIVFPFIILPPWYRTTFAYVVYMTLLFTLFWATYRWGELRKGKKNQALLAAKDKELKVKEEQFKEIKIRQEQKITELKNEKLEQELKYKSQEMANLSINLSRKNEILQDIKQELYKV
ncbi:MAG: transcriptional regulator, partial [Tannerellaceae bacterium]|nr:transcriptional regulator [Tannerellaceae bacterium]